MVDIFRPGGGGEIPGVGEGIPTPGVSVGPAVGMIGAWALGVRLGAWALGFCSPGGFPGGALKSGMIMIRIPTAKIERGMRRFLFIPDLLVNLLDMPRLAEFMSGESFSGADGGFFGFAAVGAVFQV